MRNASLPRRLPSRSEFARHMITTPEVHLLVGPMIAVFGERRTLPAAAPCGGRERRLVRRWSGPALLLRARRGTGAAGSPYTANCVFAEGAICGLAYEAVWARKAASCLLRSRSWRALSMTGKPPTGAMTSPRFLRTLFPGIAEMAKRCTIVARMMRASVRPKVLPMHL
jgi:hypothetical protein